MWSLNIIRLTNVCGKEKGSGDGGKARGWRRKEKDEVDRAKYRDPTSFPHFANPGRWCPLPCVSGIVLPWPHFSEWLFWRPRNEMLGQTSVHTAKNQRSGEDESIRKARARGGTEGSFSKNTRPAPHSLRPEPVGPGGLWGSSPKGLLCPWPINSWIWWEVTGRNRKSLASSSGGLCTW